MVKSNGLKVSLTWCLQEMERLHHTRPTPTRRRVGHTGFRWKQLWCAKFMGQYRQVIGRFVFKKQCFDDEQFSKGS
jgi:hypothetical protein